MAPEQTMRGAAITPATDVWALGLLVYRMLTGRSYWKGANAAEGEFSLGGLVLEVVVHPLAPASQRAAEYGVAQLLPAGFDAWFARCVVREQAQRFADASAAWDALEPLLGAAPAPSPPTHATPAAPAVTHLPTQAAPMPAQRHAPVAPAVLHQPTQAAPAWSQSAPQAVRWPMVQQRVYASVQGGAFQLATVLEVNTQTAMIRIRLDAGGEGWVPAAHLRSTF
jgi:serine/threonine protein kinase